MRNKNYIFEYILIFISYLTLLLGFYFNENSIGGANYDFSVISKVIIAFSENLSETFNNYGLYKIAHLPYYYILLGFIYKITNDFLIIKALIIHASLLLPFLFYKIIKLNNENINKKYILILLCIFFISPSFRSTAIWALNDNISLIFFTTSIFFFYKFKNSNNQKEKFINIIFIGITLSISAYIRQYYAIFIIFYLVALFDKKNLKIYSTFLIINFFLVLPAIFTVFGSSNFNYAFTINNFNSSTSSIDRVIDLFTNYFLALTMFVLYLVPLFFSKENLSSFYLYYLKRKMLIALFFLISLIYFFFLDYDNNYGGGLFLKIFNYLEISDFFWIIIFISLLMINYFIKDNLKFNLPIILSIILISSLQATFQKYYDPLSIVLIFCLFKSEMTNNFFIKINKNISYLMFYFIFLYFGSLSYYN